jgi:hypothetical protein
MKLTKTILKTLTLVTVIFMLAAPVIAGDKIKPNWDPDKKKDFSESCTDNCRDNSSRDLKNTNCDGEENADSDYCIEDLMTKGPKHIKDQKDFIDEDGDGICDNFVG